MPIKKPKPGNRAKPTPFSLGLADTLYRTGASRTLPHSPNCTVVWSVLAYVGGSYHPNGNQGVGLSTEHIYEA